MDIEVVSLGIVEREGSPRTYYPPGRYEDVPDDVAAALRAQGVLAPEPEAPASGGKKAKGA